MRKKTLKRLVKRQEAMLGLYALEFRNTNNLIESYNEGFEKIYFIHRPVQYGEQIFCAMCSYSDVPESVFYPCETILAIPSTFKEISLNSGSAKAGNPLDM